MRRAAMLAVIGSLAIASTATARIVLVETPEGPVYTYVPEPAGNALPKLSPRRLPWLPLIDECAQRHGVDARLVEAIVACESGFDPRAVSSAGAEGLMQLMPQTAGEYGLDDAFDATSNVDAGTRHLADLLRTFDGDWKLATAAYNAGAGAVRRAGGIPAYPETMHYVRKVDHYLGMLGADMPSSLDGVSWSGEPAEEPAAEPVVLAEAAPPARPEPPVRRGPKPVITRDDRGQTLFTNTPAARKPYVEPQIQPDAQPLPQEGRLHDPATLPRLLTWLSRGEWSGLVSVKAGDIERRIYFVEGRVGTAGSTDPADSLASRLIREGLLTDEDRSKVAGQHRLPDRGYAFGRQLVKLGMLSDEDLRRAERRRVVAIAESTLALRTGTYACEPGVLAGDAQPPQGIEVPRIVAEGMLMHWEANAALEVLGGRDAIADLEMEHLAEHESTGADESYDYTVLLCNGHRSIGEILAASPLPEAAALRFLAALRLLGIVSSRPAETVRPEAEVEAEELNASDEVEEPTETAPQAEAPGVPSVAAPPPLPARPVEEPASPPVRPAPRASPAPAPKAPAAPGRKRTGLVVAALVVLLMVAACAFLWMGWREMAREQPQAPPVSLAPAPPGAAVVIEEPPAPAAAPPLEPATASAPDGGAPETP